MFNGAQAPSKQATADTKNFICVLRSHADNNA